MRAETEAEIRSGLVEIAGLLGLPEAQAQEQDLAVEAARRWLSTHDGWLLVFDNADRPEVLRPFLPRDVRGRVLLTSRAPSFAALGIRDPFRIKTWPLEEARAFLLDRVGRKDASDDERQAAGELAGELGYLPLALEQAAAYVESRQIRFASYLETFGRRHLDLLKKAGPETGDYPATVATTWEMSFQAVEKESAAAADLLRAFAFLAPDAIPLELIELGGGGLGPAVAAAQEAEALPDALAVALRYSLVERDEKERTVSVHRLVQAVVRAGLDEAAERGWAERVVRALSKVHPGGDEFEMWPLCERLATHAEAAERLSVDSLPGALLLNAAATYAQRRGRYAEAEPLYERALATREKALGPEHPDVGTSLNNLAFLYRNQGRHAEAEPLYERSLSILEKALGPEHPHTVLVRKNLSTLRAAQD